METSRKSWKRALLGWCLAAAVLLSHPGLVSVEAAKKPDTQVTICNWEALNMGLSELGIPGVTPYDAVTKKKISKRVVKVTYSDTRYGQLNEYVTFKYDANGQLKKKTDYSTNYEGSGSKESSSKVYSYDGDGHLKKYKYYIYKEYSATATFETDAMGRIVYEAYDNSATGGRSESTYTYKSGRLTRTTYTSNYVGAESAESLYKYDANGHLTVVRSRTIEDKKTGTLVKLHPDASGRISSATVERPGQNSKKEICQFSYDKDGYLTRIASKYEGEDVTAYYDLHYETIK